VMQAFMAWLAPKLLIANFTWYALLAICFGIAMQPGKAVYFLGAAILTIGVILM